MCEVEDCSGRQVHRAIKWQKAAQRLKKERWLTTWHKGVEGQISALLIIDPTAGDLASSLTEACQKFEEATDIKVAVKLRAGIERSQSQDPVPCRFIEKVWYDTYHLFVSYQLTRNSR